MHKKEPINVPARQSFPCYKMVVAQPSEPMGHDAKMRIRGRAKNLGVYRTQVILNQTTYGHNDAGEEIAIDTLGRYIFGVPGYKGHIDVTPTEKLITINLFCEDIAAREMLEDTLDRMGLQLLYTAGIDQEHEARNTLAPPHGKVMAHIETIWDDIRESLRLCGDIGGLDPDDFTMMERRQGIWTGTRPPIAAEDVLGAVADLNSIEGQAIYATLASEAMSRLLPDLDYLQRMSFGEMYGSAIAGWSGRYGNLDEITLELENVFCYDGMMRAAYMMAQGGRNWFADSEVQHGMQKVHEYLRQGRVENVAQ